MICYSYQVLRGKYTEISIIMALIALNFALLVKIPGGLPAIDSGDFVGPVGEAGWFIFSATENRPCIDIFIFEDDVFEGEEEFDVEFQFFMLEDGSTPTTLTGVTVQPRMATVIIEDVNSKFIAGCSQQTFP